MACHLPLAPCPQCNTMLQDSSGIDRSRPAQTEPALSGNQVSTLHLLTNSIFLYDLISDVLKTYWLFDVTNDSRVWLHEVVKFQLNYIIATFQIWTQVCLATEIGK